jgi:hypothetical protein
MSLFLFLGIIIEYVECKVIRSSSNINTNGIWKQINSDILGENIGDQFGSSIGISKNGQTFVVGAPKYDQSGVIVLNSGQARVYSIMNTTNTSSSLTSTSIQQVGRSLIGQSKDDLFGTAVAMSADGTRIVVGAPLHDTTERSINAGRVSVYEYKIIDFNTNLYEWNQVGTDIYGIAGVNNSDLFGASVAMSADGNIIVIGAPNHTSFNKMFFTKYDFFGYVSVYYYSDRWRQIELEIIGNTTGSISYNTSKFGTSVDISADGTMIVIGTVHDSTIIGYVRVYLLNITAESISNRWVQVGSDIVVQTTNIASSISVAISGDGTTILIGTIGNENARNVDAGYVRVYTMNTPLFTPFTSWIQVGSDITGDEITFDDSFISVAISYDGTIIAIGAPLNRNTNTEDLLAGLVRVYALVDNATTNNQQWKQIGSDLNSITDDNSGAAIALSDDGTILAIGAPFNNNGYVRVCQYDTSGIVPTVSPTRRFTPPSNKNCGLFGLNIFCFGSGECGIIRRYFHIGGC